MINSKKIVLIGHFGVGKSSITRRFVNNVFTDDYKVTIGVNILKKELEINDAKFTFVIWDLEGKDDIEKTRKSHLLGTSGFIYVIDPTRTSTYINIKHELAFLKSNFPKTHLLTVANKSDLIEIEEFQKGIDFSIDYFTSAKTSENVDLIFNQLGLIFLNNL